MECIYPAQRRIIHSPGTEHNQVRVRVKVKPFAALWNVLVSILLKDGLSTVQVQNLSNTNLSFDTYTVLNSVVD